MGEFIIRDATLQDSEAIYLLNRDALGYDYPPEKTAERLRYVLDAGLDHIFVAEADGKVVGYIHGSPYECTYIDSLKNILALAVAESHRARGVGRALLAALENWARDSGCSGVRLVSGYNREGAHKFYLACGYQNRKDQKNFIKMF